MREHTICNKQGNMEQKGLEVPITVQCAISSKKRIIMKRLKQRINKRWRDSRVIILAIIRGRKCVSNIYNTNANIAVFYFVVQQPSHVTPLLLL